MHESTRKYYEAIRDFDEAIKSRLYKRATLAQKRGLWELRDCLPDLVSTFGALPPSVPFIDSQGRTLAAMQNDPEVLSLLEAIASDPAVEGRLSFPAVLAEVASVKLLREKIYAGAGATRSELTAHVQRETGVDKRRSGALLDMMAKSGDLTVDRSGAAALYRAAEQQNTVPKADLIVAFRSGRDPIQPELLNLSGVVASSPRPQDWLEPEQPPIDEYHRLVGLREAAPFDLDTGEHPTGTPIPPAERLTGRGTTIVLANATWVLWKKKPAESNRSEGFAYIRDRSGALVSEMTLGHDVVRHFGYADRTTLVLLDSDLRAHVYREDGALVASYSLRDTPEVSTTIEAWNAIAEFPLKDTSAVRAIDFGPQERLLVTVLDRLWVYSPDGEVLYSLRVPGARDASSASVSAVDQGALAAAAVMFGLPSDATIDEIAYFAEESGISKVSASPSMSMSFSFGEEPDRTAEEIIRDAVGNLSTDWIYGAWLTPEGGCVLTTYSGQGAELGRGVELDASGTPTRTWRGRGERKYHLAPQGYHSWPTTAPTWFAFNTPELLTIASSPPTEVTARIVLPAGFTTYYPAGDTVVVETKTKRYIFGTK